MMRRERTGSSARASFARRSRSRLRASAWIRGTTRRSACAREGYRRRSRATWTRRCGNYNLVIAARRGRTTPTCGSDASSMTFPVLSDYSWGGTRGFSAGRDPATGGQADRDSLHTWGGTGVGTGRRKQGSGATRSSAGHAWRERGLGTGRQAPVRGSAGGSGCALGLPLGGRSPRAGRSLGQELSSAVMAPLRFRYDCRYVSVTFRCGFFFALTREPKFSPYVTVNHICSTACDLL